MLRRCALAAARRSPSALPLPPPGSIAGGAVDTSKYVAELLALKEVLLAARAEQETLEKRVQEVRAGPSYSRQARSTLACRNFSVGTLCAAPPLPPDPRARASRVQLESEKGKLQYQVLHLKRAVQEADERLAAAGAAKQL